MQLAVLGDIHGNINAFNAVLEDIKNESVNKLLITGDLVGYYYHADQVLNVLKDLDYELVQGNHDYMLSEFYTWDVEMKDAYRKKYGTALECAAKELLGKEQISYLANLPHSKEFVIAGRRILLCHGSPLDRDEYLYPDVAEDVLNRFANGKFDVVIMGHTHYPMIRRCNSTLFLNPGSVGQPRNKRPGASWALLDLENFDVQIRQVTYDIEEVVVEARQNDPEVPYLAEVLMGR
ncbi:MAG: metallophosphatase family protein [Candidatus Margulisbacteria bacterium]|nr:metallophosphatase family protein [Candidatus Margulisiibacteriota bacterium]MBU1021520.1 metallophosphatase family protein [Candidatus Margulisiibacteriota bacterium]MBU1728605.1 metallophosphatase family protein [Candidatus Margulisiibacteriota bacterium]MBU1955816.1 metallophosphatase family protein [Candidatus Margulisiibacteriota bacterium]